VTRVTADADVPANQFIVAVAKEIPLRPRWNVRRSLQHAPRFRFQVDVNVPAGPGLDLGEVAGATAKVHAGSFLHRWIGCR
jgi:hypothetical protein